MSGAPRFKPDQLPPKMRAELDALDAKESVLRASPADASVDPSDTKHPPNRPKGGAGRAKEHETDIQQRLIKWWALARLEHRLPEIALMAFPLQGRRTPANASRMKAEGMRAGTLDLLLAVKRGGSGGLWIEMKAEDGRVSEFQASMIAYLLTAGYDTVVCYGFDEAVSAITTYLNENRPAA